MYRMLLIGLALCWPFFASAQTNNTLARMNQDILLLSEQMGTLRQQIEDMKREQQQMQRNYEQLTKQQQALTANLNTFVAQMEGKMTEREAAMQQEFSKQLNDLAKQTEAGFKRITDSINNQPSITVPRQTAFSQDYPDTGFPHVVQSGETISGIARKYGAKTKDIMNANNISDARGLKAGETIFVPVAQ